MGHAGSPRLVISGIGVVTTALVDVALSRGFPPPTINQDDPDPACDLDVIPHQGRASYGDVALCHGVGFGSKNRALVIRRV